MPRTQHILPLRLSHWHCAVFPTRMALTHQELTWHVHYLRVNLGITQCFRWEEAKDSYSLQRQFLSSFWSSCALLCPVPNIWIIAAQVKGLMCPTRAKNKKQTFSVYFQYFQFSAEIPDLDKKHVLRTLPFCWTNPCSGLLQPWAHTHSWAHDFQPLCCCRAWTGLQSHYSIFTSFALEPDHFHWTWSGC